MLCGKPLPKEKFPDNCQLSRIPWLSLLLPTNLDPLGIGYTKATLDTNVWSVLVNPQKFCTGMSWLQLLYPMLFAQVQKKSNSSPEVNRRCTLVWSES